VLPRLEKKKWIESIVTFILNKLMQLYTYGTNLCVARNTFRCQSSAPPFDGAGLSQTLV
jgi:hypothetical protein